MENYQQLADCLRARGIESFLQNPETLVVSRQNPAMPNSNSFWVTKKSKHWCIGTWLPAVYQVKDEERICDICESVFQSSATAIYTIEPSLAATLNLRRLTPAELKKYGF
jgi:hypothetical protein